MRQLKNTISVCAENAPAFNEDDEVEFVEEADEMGRIMATRVTKREPPPPQETPPPQDTVVKQGNIAWLDPVKRVGFILADDGTGEVFAHEYARDFLRADISPNQYRIIPYDCHTHMMLRIVGVYYINIHVLIVLFV